MRGRSASFLSLGSSLPVLILAGMVLVLPACKKSPPPAAELPPFSLSQTVEKLAGFALNDDFFAVYDDLRANLNRDPAGRAAYVRISLTALALVAGKDSPQGHRLLNGDGRDPAVVTGFLKELEREAPQTVQPVLSGLRSVYGMGGRPDLQKLYDVADGDGELSPALRMLLINSLFDGIVEAAASPESVRGAVLMDKVPGLPNPPTQDQLKTAFPAQLMRLGAWLTMGAGTETSLAPNFEQLNLRASKALGGAMFALPVTPDPVPRAGTALGGLRPAQMALDVMTVDEKGIYLGQRPVVAFSDGRFALVNPDVVVPGTLAIPADLPDAKPRPRDELVAALATAQVILQEKGVDSLAVPASAPEPAVEGGVLPTVESVRPLQVMVGANVTAQDLGSALDLAGAVQRTDIRILPPGPLGRVLPVFYRKSPPIDKGASSSKPSVIMVLSDGGVTLYPPAVFKKKLPTSGWPEGAKVAVSNKVPYMVSVPWTAEKGFGGVLAGAVEQMVKTTGAGPLAQVIVRGGKIGAVAVLDAVSEIEAVQGETAEELMGRFADLKCPQPGPCPSLIPVIFSGVAMPKTAKTIDVATETRPAGFCDKGAVKRVMMGRSGAYRFCYEAALKRSPELTGRLEVRFTIEPDGSVSGISATQNELNDKVRDCIIGQVSKLKFTKPDGGVCVIRWPFKFTPGGY